MKIVNIEEETLLNELRDFNEVFRKNVIYDNIKCHKKGALDSFSEKRFLRKTTGRSQIDPPSLFRVKAAQL